MFIHSENRYYGEKLARYIADRHNPEITVELLTEIKETAGFEPGACVISDDAQILADLDCRKIYLGKMPEVNRENEIFMYQKKEDIYRQIINLAGVQEQKDIGKGGGTKTKIVCIFSPEGSDEKTVLALQTALEQGHRGDVLYVSLCEFPAFFQEEICENPDTNRQGVSELMLCEEEMSFQEKLEQLVYVAGKIFMLAPAGHYKDLLDFSTEEVCRFVDHLRKQTRFVTVIIEIGTLLEFVFPVLQVADEIRVPQEPGFFAEVKRHVLQEYCRREGYEGLWNRMKFVPTGFCTPEDRESVCRLLDGESVLLSGETSEWRLG